MRLLVVVVDGESGAIALRRLVDVVLLPPECAEIAVCAYEARIELNGSLVVADGLIDVAAALHAQGETVMCPRVVWREADGLAQFRESFGGLTGIKQRQT